MEAMGRDRGWEVQLSQYFQKGSGNFHLICTYVKVVKASVVILFFLSIETKCNEKKWWRLTRSADQERTESTVGAPAGVSLIWEWTLSHSAWVVFLGPHRSSNCRVQISSIIASSFFAFALLLVKLVHSVRISSDLTVFLGAIKWTGQISVMSSHVDLLQMLERNQIEWH